MLPSSSYFVSLHEDAAKMLEGLDASVRARLIKRIARMRSEPPGRHMAHGLDFFVEEAGQYRIVYTVEGDSKIVYFAGRHKDYEKWYSIRGK